MFTPYSQLSADEQAARKLVAIRATLPAKLTSASRVLGNAINHLRGLKSHPDNQGECARLWKRLSRTRQ